MTIVEAIKVMEETNSVERAMEVCKECNDEIVQLMLEKYKKEILMDITPQDHPVVYIVGGQNASGKSKLITTLGEKNKKSVYIAIDNMKAHHPFRNVVNRRFTNDSEKLLHLACFDVFNKLFNQLLKEGYNLVIERTLGKKDKSHEYVKMASKYNYDVQIHVTATHELNSLVQSLERFIIEARASRYI